MCHPIWFSLGNTMSDVTKSRLSLKRTCFFLCFTVSEVWGRKRSVVDSWLISLMYNLNISLTFKSPLDSPNTFRLSRFMNKCLMIGLVTKDERVKLKKDKKTSRPLLFLSKTYFRVIRAKWEAFLSL